MTTSSSETGILYLNRKDVERVCEDINAVAIMRNVFTMHGFEQANLPEEAYLGWVNSQGEHVRSLNMPGYLGGAWRVAGTKIINGNICNPERGVPRANGITLLFDDTSARIVCLMEGAYLSSLRTAAVTALAADLLGGPVIHCVAIIGAGVLAQAHVELLLKHLPQLQQIFVFDVNRERVKRLQHHMAPALQAHDVILQAAATAEEAIRPAQLIVPVTTVTMGYIRFEWLQPGSLLVNVSLDDPLPEVVLKATTVVVDDWKLVKSDQRRLLGRMYREGRLIGPEEQNETSRASCRRVDMQLGDLLVGAKIGRRSLDDIILVNPFGLAIEDIALAAEVYQKAQARSIGVRLER